MSRRVGHLGAAAAILATACAPGPEGGPSPMAEVTDSGGVQLVRSRGVTVAADLVEELRIGTVEGEEPYQLFRVTSVTRAPGGDIYVSNSGSGTIRVFGPDGTFLREMGGQGPGPGEFQALGSVALAGDTILAQDLMGRAALLTDDGEFLTGWPTFRSDTREQIVPMGITGGTWVARYRPALDPASLTPGLWVDTVRYHVFHPEDGSVGAEIVTFPGPARILGSRGEASAGPLFDPTPAGGIDAAGHALVTAGDVYRIDVVDTSGRLVRRISREHEVRPVQEAWTEDFRTRVTDFYAGRGESAEAERDRIIEDRVGMIRGESLPPTGMLLVAPDGAFWVERTDLAANPALREFQRTFGYGQGEPPPTTWDVFNAQGVYTATVELAASFRPMAVEADGVLGVLRDELDVEYVVRYGVVPREAGPVAEAGGPP